MWIKGDVLLKDIEKRINFWDDNHLAYQQGDSIKVPFDKHIHLFDNKKVLEIGPGEGRQYEVVCDIVKEYAIADISQKVLNRPLYNNIKIKDKIMTEYIEIPNIGEVLLEEFLEPLNLSQNALAKAINVPSNRINAIIRGQRGITADTDLRLTKYFGLTKGYFLRLQAELELLESERKIENDLSNIVPIDYNSLKKVSG